MKRITIGTLSIRNFKGCHELSLDLSGKSASIYGDNAAGKTTVYDALTWLLFGKDSSGAGKFNIKPLNEDGEVLDHAAETSVEAVLLVDGEPVTLKRTYFELWSKKRGSREATFDGHSSNFYYNGLPVQKNEFAVRVGQLCDENTFRILTDLRWFCAGESEANRRAVLFDLIGGVSEEDVLVSDPAFTPLADALSGLTVEQYKKASEKQRRTLQTKSKTIPARIDECKRTVAEFEAWDYDDLRQKRDQTRDRMEDAQRHLNALRSQSGDDALVAKRDGLKMQLDALKQQNEAHRATQQNPEKIRLLKQEDAQILTQIQRIELEQRSYVDEWSRLEREVQRCREDWSAHNAAMKDVAAQSFDGANCPTCGQTLPPDQIEARKAKWMEEHDERLRRLQGYKDRCTETANAAKARMDELKERETKRTEERQKLNERLSQISEQIRQMQSEPVTDLPEYAQRNYELTHDIVELEEQIHKARQGNAEGIAAARGKFVDLQRELDRVNGLLAGETALNNAKAREQELMEEQRRTAAETERLDALLDLCDDFTRAKAEYIDTRVNGLFRRVRWQLFETQINGGLRDCCRATVDGVPYADLNNGAKINAGIDVISTLSAAKDIRVPLFVDNAESVTALECIDTQVIRLVVSSDDKTLRMEVEG